MSLNEGAKPQRKGRRTIPVKRDRGRAAFEGLGPRKFYLQGIMAGSIKAWAGRLKRDVAALWLAARDPRTPWAAKAVAGAVAAYALSPIDLIPDFIPVLGLLDDALLVPLGIMLAVRLIPAPLLAEFRAEAERLASRPRSWAGAAAVVFLWATAIALAAWLWVG